MKRNDDFDSRLETELRRRLHGASAAPPPYPRYKSVAHGGMGVRHFRLLSGAGAAFAAKAGTGLVVAAFAVGATGTALSGSPNPAAWGTTVHQVVDQCKAGASVEGLDGCVTAVSQERRDAVVTPNPPPEPKRSAPPAATPTTAPGGKHEDEPDAPSPKLSARPERRPSPSPSARPRVSPRRSPSEDRD